MILPYYKIERTEEGRQFFYNHIGYFNFWDEYLIMNVGLEYKTYIVLVNRPNRQFSCVQIAEDFKVKCHEYLKESICQRKPEEMFEDFPELKEFNYLKYLEVNTYEQSDFSIK